MYAHMPIIRDIVYGAVARGVSLQQLCERLEINVADLNDSERRIDFKSAYRAWELAVQLTADPLLGLHLGESTNPSILGLVGHLMQSSPDLWHAFKKVSEYSEVATTMFHYRVKEKNDEVILQFDPASLWIKLSPQSARHATEQAMAGTLQVFRLLSGASVYPTSTTFQFRRKEDKLEYDRVFHSPVLFHSAFNQLVFTKAQLQLPVISYDRSLYAVFDQLLKERKTRAKTACIADQLRHLILSEFKGQVPPVEILASRLNLTTRSLQRRLSDEHTSFRVVAAAIKKELAVQFLSQAKSRVNEVASLLGYSESSSFRRAYKSWAHKTPRQS